MLPLYATSASGTSFTNIGYNCVLQTSATYAVADAAAALDATDSVTPFAIICPTDYTCGPGSLAFDWASMPASRSHRKKNTKSVGRHSLNRWGIMITSIGD